MRKTSFGLLLGVAVVAMGASLSSACSTTTIAAESPAAPTADGGADGATEADGSDPGDDAAADPCSPDTMCGTTCTNTFADPRNCITCGHSCLDEECAPGGCAPTELVATDALGPVIAVDATNIYFTEEAPGGTLVRSIPKAGGTPVTLATTSEGTVSSLAVTGTHLVLNVQTSTTGPFIPDLVATCELPTCTTLTPVFPADGKSREYSVVTTDGTSAFWVVGLGTRRGSVESCPLGGCAAANALVSGASPAQKSDAAIGLLGDELFWATEDDPLAHCPKAGPCSGGTVVAGSGGVTAIATDATRVFFANAAGISACAAPTCAGGPTKIVDVAKSHGLALASDGTEIFFDAYDTMGIHACPVAGCTTSPREATIYGPVQGGNIVVDGPYIYMVTEFPRTLVRVVKS